jgi:uncharacterized protein
LIDKKASNKSPDKKIKPCLQCGNCCGPYFSLYVDEVDEKRWESENRTDLLERLEYERNHVLWKDETPMNSETGEPFEKCVFLTIRADGKALCGIHHTKPKICRDFPPGGSELCVLFDGRKGTDKP